MTSTSYFIGFLVENFATVFHSVGNMLLHEFRYNSCEIKLKQTSENFVRKLKIPVRMEETFGGHPCSAIIFFGYLECNPEITKLNMVTLLLNFVLIFNFNMLLPYEMRFPYQFQNFVVSH